MKRILIPIDGSENSKKALLEGKRLAEAFESEILLLYVEPEPKLRGPYSEVYMPVADERIEKVGKKIIDEGLEVLNKPVDSMIEYGDPAEVIIQIAETKKIDLIVMGSRGLSGIKRFVLGSVSYKVLNHVNTSVHIVR